MATRPEHVAPADVFYDADEARKYTASSRMRDIQERLTSRALELLALPDDGLPKMLLDLGCGSGLSGDVLTRAGHHWVGMDLSRAMLEVAVERGADGDVLEGDLGHGLPVRQGVFDGAVSISAVQWLCNADRKEHDPRKRMKAFFQQLYRCLARGARAVLQIYPDSPQQAELLTTAALRAGFAGGLVVDYPNSARAKKYYLVLMVGTVAALPQARDGEEGAGDEVRVAKRQKRDHRGKAGGGGGGGGGSKRHPDGKGRAWVLKKKEQYRQKGRESVPMDSKYTGRKRPRNAF